MVDIKISENKKFLEESITDYYLLVNYLLRNHSGVFKEFQDNVLKGRAIKSGLNIK